MAYADNGPFVNDYDRNDFEYPKMEGKVKEVILSSWASELHIDSITEAIQSLILNNIGELIIRIQGKLNLENSNNELIINYIRENQYIVFSILQEIAVLTGLSIEKLGQFVAQKALTYRECGHEDSETFLEIAWLLYNAQEQQA